MVRSVEKMIKRYGTPMTLVQSGTETAIRAFLQESRSKSQSGTEREFSPLGEVKKGLFVYIGPAEPEAAAGDVLLWKERQFELRRAELIMAGEEAVYCWGLCVEKAGDDTWGS